MEYGSGRYVRLRPIALRLERLDEELGVLRGYHVCLRGAGQNYAVIEIVDVSRVGTQLSASVPARETEQTSIPHCPDGAFHGLWIEDR